MADQEEDFSQLPLPDRFVHKNWKVRKEAYEAAVKDFDKAQDESDPVVRQFIQDPGLWKGAVADSNVAAQQEALSALCSFLQIAGPQGCTRTRNLTIVPIVEKGLTGRPAAKQKALEALLLYIELDKADPVIEELLPILSHKQPKIIAATLNALTSIYNSYGCKTVEPKPVLKVLPKVFGHADKNVRAEAQALTVEFYRWLKEGMKPLFWNDLKPVQQQDLEKLFEKVKDEPAPKQQRLLRSQQAVQESAAPSAGGGADADGGAEDEEDAGIDLEPEFMAVDVMPKIPKDFQERISSSKWKDRKEVLDELHTAINYPKIEEGQFSDIISALAKCMKDANIAVVTVATNCVELFAKGLRKGFARFRGTIIPPMMERLKEKKQSVTDAIGAALDAVFQATSLAECLEDILEFLKHKNPQVKLESTRFLIRSLKTTRTAPEPPEVKSIADAATKLLTESQETQRSAGAEVLGTLWKIMGDRIMSPHLEGLDEIRKTKIKEFFEAAEVKAKWKPKAAAPPPKPAASAGPPKKTLGKKPAPAGPKKSAPPSATATPPAEDPAPALAPRPTSRPGASKLGGPKPSGLTAPSGLTRLQKKPTSSTSSSGVTSPKRQQPTPPAEDPTPAPALKLSSLGSRGGLTGRPLGKPTPPPTFDAPLAPFAAPTLSPAEKAELDHLREEIEAMRRDKEEWRHERSRLNSQIHELQLQNAQLIEDHTRDVLSQKAKETQLVRARGDAEAAGQEAESARREVDRLKRELSRLNRAASPAGFERNGSGGMGDGVLADGAAGVNGAGAGTGLFGPGRSRSYLDRSASGEGKENLFSPVAIGSLKLSPVRVAASGYDRPPAQLERAHTLASIRPAENGRASPALSGDANGGAERPGLLPRAESSRELAGGARRGDADGGESWKRAAEVTQNLKTRIELMKAKQLSRQASH
ncbi:hypothetical protein W97_06257 [Coniosporium apollinis CBS 100218]|uniref:TOG domain-containing protein n=1 Tax=Coniosporium apollinis (strain CBS 100218) TaxID=1168221 RepID=R7YY31_CONA1|nr:uncharacterized protein W97_06257 [Coniosporium apollinis CBS 100218]EON66855.1 hypothetical protein W97_06257 [Coniosporium apollinis CBS 100218]